MVLKRLYLIFQRYAEQNLLLKKPGAPLIDPKGRRFGQVDRIELHQNRLIISGWSSAARIGILLRDTSLWCSPRLAQSHSNERGFTLDIPFAPGPFIIHSDEGKGPANEYPISMSFEGFSAHQVTRARLKLIIPYLFTVLCLLPQIILWKFANNNQAHQTIKKKLGLCANTVLAEMPPHLFATKPPAASTAAGVRIILPVFNAYDFLKECGARVFEHTDIPWHLVVVEDRSSDPRVLPLLKSWQTLHPENISILQNDENIGFLGSVNRALDFLRDCGHPVVLLNSDAFVAKNWASRMLAPLEDPQVASVTPMTNNGEIFSAPAICRAVPLSAKQVDVLDQAAAQLNPDAFDTNAPTGVGFCMALSPHYLAKAPHFDPIFGKGYGEETDWCQRTRSLGGRHVCAVNVFVEHRGGESFGSAQKQKLLQNNGAIISHRYPSYDQEVQNYIRQDPLNGARLALGLTWAQLTQKEVPVFVAHSMGGGAEKYLVQRIKKLNDKGQSAVVLRVGQTHQWQLELHSPLGCIQGSSEETALIIALLENLTCMRLVYSCGVGAKDALTLPDVLLKIARQNGRTHSIEMLFHDFFPISPSYTLLNDAGIYQGVPRAHGKDAHDKAHQYSRSGQDDVPLAQWQQAWGRLISHASSCVVFSKNSFDIVKEAYPNSAKKLVIQPHSLLGHVPLISKPPKAQPEVFAVLGNIGFHKGAGVIQTLSHELARNQQARLVIIGHFDPSFPLAKGTEIHGHYELEDLPYLVKRYNISAWVIPSIWPETFSFTTHEALASGLPVITFDLGAQGDALKAAIAKGASGAVLPITNDARIEPLALLETLNQPANMRSAG